MHFFLIRCTFANVQLIRMNVKDLKVVAREDLKMVTWEDSKIVTAKFGYIIPYGS